LLKAGAGLIQDSEVRGQEEEDNWYGESEVFEPRKRRIHFEAEIGSAQVMRATDGNSATPELP
jgi:hypothetical protein